MVTIYRNYVLLYSLRDRHLYLLFIKGKNIALHPGKCKQDVVFHITQEKNGQSCLRDYKILGIYA